MASNPAGVRMDPKRLDFWRERSLAGDCSPELIQHITWLEAELRQAQEARLAADADNASLVEWARTERQMLAMLYHRMKAGGGTTATADAVGTVEAWMDAVPDSYEQHHRGEALLTELNRLKALAARIVPKGKVEEDLEEVQHAIRGAEAWWQKDLLGHRAAAARLAAKAQAYELAMDTLTTAQHEVARMDALLRVVVPEMQALFSSTCVWCASLAPDFTTAEALQDYVREHVKACAKHPMRALEEESAKALQYANDKLEVAGLAYATLDKSVQVALVRAKNALLEKLATAFLHRRSTLAANSWTGRRMGLEEAAEMAREFKEPES